MNMKNTVNALKNAGVRVRFRRGIYTVTVNGVELIAFYSRKKTIRYLKKFGAFLQMFTEDPAFELGHLIAMM